LKKKTVLPRWFLIAVGILSVGLAAAGLILPLLPTTPFLLLAAASFFRSSDRLYNWLMSHRFLGAYIESYRRYKALTMQTKVGTMLLLWGTIGFSVVFAAQSWWLRIILLLVASGVSVHVLSMKSLTLDMLSGLQREVQDRMEQVADSNPAAS